MQYQTNKSRIPTRPAKLTDPGEKERVLARYAGIFPNNIKEYGEKYTKKYRPIKNYAR